MVGGVVGVGVGVGVVVVVVVIMEVRSELVVDVL
jgi:hypothetical protein